MKKTKRNTFILLALTVASAIMTAVFLLESVIAMIVIGIISIPLYFFIFSFFYGCFGIRTTFDESLEKEEEAKDKAREMALERVMWEEEDEVEERFERRKALRRIKRLQRDYPDMWELLVDPDDEYLCHDYIDKEIKKKESDSSDMVFGYSPSHSHSDSSSSDSSGF